jgi:hypothetical protein
LNTLNLRNYLPNLRFQQRAALAFTVFAIVLAGSNASAEKLGIALLQGMDKVTARVTTISAPIGEVIKFGTLEIIARTCDKRPPEEPPESAAFLDIWEVREGSPAESLYRGWMFASSPALSAMEHPVYDVWVLDCVTAQQVEPETKEN